MAFCQVVLKQDLVDSVKTNPYGLDWWKKAYEYHLKEQSGKVYKDPLPFVSTCAFIYFVVLTYPR